MTHCHPHLHSDTLNSLTSLYMHPRHWILGHYWFSENNNFTSVMFYYLTASLILKFQFQKYADLTRLILIAVDVNFVKNKWLLVFPFSALPYLFVCTFIISLCVPLLGPSCYSNQHFLIQTLRCFLTLLSNWLKSHQCLIQIPYGASKAFFALPFTATWHAKPCRGWMDLEQEQGNAGAGRSIFLYLLFVEQLNYQQLRSQNESSILHCPIWLSTSDAHLQTMPRKQTIRHQDYERDIKLSFPLPLSWMYKVPRHCLKVIFSPGVLGNIYPWIDISKEGNLILISFLEPSMPVDLLASCTAAEKHLKLFISL